MIEKIYLDMDGVLCNFERRYFELYKELPGSMRDRKEFNVHWHDFIATKQFETLDWYPGGKELYEFITSLGVPVEILSSSGGKTRHDEVKKQKKVWLKRNNINLPANIVPGRALKVDYAKPNTILIDDTEDVIGDFNGAGGIGILHTDAAKTIAIVKSLLDDSYIDVYNESCEQDAHTN
jgi:hypothetical protein